MKPLIIGEAPGRFCGAALAGRCGDRLAGYCGLEPRTFRRLFARTNVLTTWPGPAGKGAAFDMLSARAAAVRLSGRFLAGRTVVLLGKRTAAAFRLRPVYFERQTVRRAAVYVVPHPSGVSRWHNVTRNRRAMRRFMRSVTA